MARTPKDFKVDGVKYTTSLYGYDLGIDIGEKLGVLLFEPLAVMAVAGGLKADIDAALVKVMIGGFTSGIKDLDAVQFTKDILQTTKVLDGKERRPINFDLDFAGQYGHMFKVLKEVVAFQYADLFGVIAGAAGKLQRKKETIKAR